MDIASPLPVEPTTLCLVAAPADVDTDLLVIPVFEGDGDEDRLDDLDGLDAATDGEVGRARAAREFRPKPHELFLARVVDARWKTTRIALVGAGTNDADVVDRLRTAAAAASLAAGRRRIERIAFVVRGRADATLAAQAVAEGLVLGGFEDRRWKTMADDEGAAHLSEAQVVVAPETGPMEQAVEKGRVLAASTNIARTLANEPSNVLTPTVFAARATALVAETGIRTEILDESAIAELGMGLLLGVARGSAEPPRVIVMWYEPDDAPARPALGLVGKGITFDSGGISIKPADGMDRMKEDMAGGAAVVCAMRAIGALRPPVRVIGVVPTTENMPGGRATKPGDILTSASGQTVEVINTDAEGRLILGDALWHARQLGATHLVDVATLTGACVVALGKACSGLFGQPEPWVEAVKRAGRRAGERAWPLPLFPEYREQLRSEMADLVNSGGRPGGACTAAAFLQAFAGDLPWVHLDIAGTAWCDEAQPDQSKGATGVMVRTLTELACENPNW